MPFAVLVLVGATNAVNLTDGLDGLAISVFAVAAAAFTALAYVSAHRVFANYLQLLKLHAAAAELTMFCGALVGASLGVPLVELLSRGDLHGRRRVARPRRRARHRRAAHQAGVAARRSSAASSSWKPLSVIIQVASFKLTGKRVFKMAPLHHHFELIGWSEPKVITRFVIMAIIFALFSLTTLKLR